MERKKLFARIGAVAAGAALLVALFAAAGMAGELNRFRQGVDEGFELRGTYQLIAGTRGESITFQVFDEERSWEAQDGSNSVKGAIKETADPNVYLLIDEHGDEAGWVHLAFANNEGEGTLYVRYGSGELIEMRKASRIPTYVVYD